MKFEDIQVRMLQLGVDREWLAKECDYTPGSLARILAPKGDPKAKTQKALRRIWEALDREEERQKKPTISEEKCAIIVRPNTEEFTLWNKASMKQHLTIEEWALEQLNLAAKNKAKDFPVIYAAEDQTTYKAQKKSST